MSGAFGQTAERSESGPLFTEDYLRSRLAGKHADPRRSPDLHAADPHLIHRPEELIAAAVLVGIVLGPAPGVLLTRRTDHLRRHSGQVSFPGGRIDPGDYSPEDAALREAYEEVGLESGQVELVGRLDDHVTGTGFLVTPVIGLLSAGFVADPSPDEVADVFQLPLTILLDPLAPTRQRAMHADQWRDYWVWPHPDHTIWGATAAMLVELAGRLAPPDG